LSAAASISRTKCEVAHSGRLLTPDNIPAQAIDYFNAGVSYVQ
jgi:hypothetical protein